MIWWLYTTPTDTLDVLYDERIESMIDDIDVACQRAVLGQEAKASERGWEGSLLALYTYGALACIELKHKRGIDPDMFHVFAIPGKQLVKDGAKFEMPPWYEDEDLIKSHWSAGLRTKSIISDIKPTYEDVDEYWPVLWPLPNDDGGYDLHVSKKQREEMARDDLWLPDDIRARVVNL